MPYQRITNRKPGLTQTRINGMKKILSTYCLDNALIDDEIMQGVRYIKELINYYENDEHMKHREKAKEISKQWRIDHAINKKKGIKS